MVDLLSVLQFLQLRDFTIPQKIVDHRLEDDLEVLGDKVFLAFAHDIRPMRLLEEREAEVPQRKIPVGEILVLDLPETRLAIAVQIPTEVC